MCLCKLLVHSFYHSCFYLQPVFAVVEVATLGSFVVLEIATLCSFAVLGIATLGSFARLWSEVSVQHKFSVFLCLSGGFGGGGGGASKIYFSTFSSSKF